MSGRLLADRKPEARTRAAETGPPASRLRKVTIEWLAGPLPPPRIWRGCGRGPTARIDLARLLFAKRPARRQPRQTGGRAESRRFFRSNRTRRRPVSMWRTHPRPNSAPATPDNSFAVYTPDLPAGPDALGKGGVLASVAELLAHRRTTPPLTIGLFGGRGTGKSFALAQLLDRVKRLAAAAAGLGARSPFLSRIVTVRVEAARSTGDPATAIAAEIFRTLNSGGAGAEVLCGSGAGSRACGARSPCRRPRSQRTPDRRPPPPACRTASAARPRRTPGQTRRDGPLQIGRFARRYLRAGQSLPHRGTPARLRLHPWRSARHLSRPGAQRRRSGRRERPHLHLLQGAVGLSRPDAAPRRRA